MKTIASILLALVITFGWPPATSEARPLVPGEPMVVWVFCGTTDALEKMAVPLAMNDNDAYTTLLHNKDVQCFSSQLGHFPVIQGALFVRYLEIDLMTLTGQEFYGAEAFYQGMTLYFFVGENLAPIKSNKI